MSAGNVSYFVKVWRRHGGKEKWMLWKHWVEFVLFFEDFWVKDSMDETALRRANNQLSKVQRNEKDGIKRINVGFALDKSRALGVQIV